ncbi:MAG: hypothetical protein ACI8PQ_003155 [Planctomycetota bacterium]|jgi:hypothetical protein
MNHFRRSLVLASVAVLCTAPPAGASSAAYEPVSFQADSTAIEEYFTGSWQGELRVPFDSKPLAVRFGIELGEDGNWRGGFDADMLGPGLLRGVATETGLELECDLGGGVNPLVLSRDGDGGLAALLSYSGMQFSVKLDRTSLVWTEDLHFEVLLPSERPSQVALEGLPEFWLDPIEEKVFEALDTGQFVGLSMAIAVDGELMDSRSWGWSDVESDRAVDGQTLFRWGSISKSITGVVAAKMSQEGVLDLDRNVIEFVPEFPKKKYAVTTRQLLGHLGGIAHYQHMPVVTRRNNDVEFPFRDPVRAIEMFHMAPLIHEPGASFSYSTHGFVLVGAVLERSSERGFLGEVERLVRSPLGLSSLVPDDPAAPLGDRTSGYRRTSDGRIFNSGDTNVAWKLAGGGFQSSISDLARFGAALGHESFIDDPLRDLLFESQRTDAGLAAR